VLIYNDVYFQVIDFIVFIFYKLMSFLVQINIKNTPFCKKDHY
jgi:hypothetical protein